MKERWQELYEQGRRAFEARDYGLARRLFEQMLHAKDDCADVYNMLGVIHSLEDRKEEAIECFKKALDINPFYIEAGLNLSILYNDTCQFERAQRAYAAAKASGGNHNKNSYLDPYVKGRLANKHAEIGNIYSELGLYREAIGQYRLALSLRADLVDIKMRLAIAYRNSGDYQSAIAELKEAIELNPAFVQLRVQLGLTYYAMGELDRARKEWAEALKVNPKDRLLRLYLRVVDGVADG